VAVAALFLVWGAMASAATPAWECVPTAHGADVISGGTGSAPVCGTGSAAVLAPTYEASGIDGKPTVLFGAPSAGVNVQIVNGSGSTSKVNGTGNLVLGYDENPSNHAQTGSHDLILGEGQSYSGYAEL